MVAPDSDGSRRLRWVWKVPWRHTGRSRRIFFVLFISTATQPYTKPCFSIHQCSAHSNGTLRAACCFVILWSESRETDLYVLYTTYSSSGQNRYHLAVLRAAIELTRVDRFANAQLDSHSKGHQGSCRTRNKQNSRSSRATRSLSLPRYRAIFRRRIQRRI